jgi:hypothetical protein
MRSTRPLRTGCVLQAAEWQCQWIEAGRRCEQRSNLDAHHLCSSGSRAAWTRGTGGRSAPITTPRSRGQRPDGGILSPPWGYETITHPVSFHEQKVALQGPPLEALQQSARALQLAGYKKIETDAGAMMVRSSKWSYSWGQTPSTQRHSISISLAPVDGGVEATVLGEDGTGGLTW